MSAWEELIGRRRSAVLAGIMIAILLASVAGAAWLVQRRQGNLGRAVEVLEHIRLKGLPAFWGREPVALWYLRRNADGDPIGWLTLQREPVSGGYSGRNISRTGRLIGIEAWEIDSAARTCRYSANLSALLRPAGASTPLLRQVSSTTITLRDGRTTVRGTNVGSATSEAPANYVPEGLSCLAEFLTASGGQRANYAMILNDEAVQGGQVRFTRVSALPEGPRRVRVTIAAFHGSSTVVRSFDEKGNLQREVSTDLSRRLERSSYEAVREKFPEVELYAAPWAAEPTGEPNEPEGE